MGTISSRQKKDGSTSHTAQIRIMRNGKRVYQESQTFDRKPAAKAWMKKREVELGEPGALERAMRQGVTLREMVYQYLEQYEKVRPLGSTKRFTLKAIAASWLGDVLDCDLTSQKLVEYGVWRTSDEGGGVQPQTVGNDLSHLGAVMAVARPAWGYDIDPHAMADARKVLRRMGLSASSSERNRRPELEELDRLLTHFSELQLRRPTSINMLKVVGFALFSTRRQEEITRIRWADVDDAHQRVLVRDMKNPGQKIGNDVWCSLPDEAWAILQSMPRTCDEIFPYNSDSISAAWTRTCKFLNITDLRFHDLRHEGVSRLFEMGWDIPRVSSVSGHRDWNSLRRYTHLQRRGNRFEGWEWLQKIVDAPVELGARVRGW
ncbi:Phage integrase family protein [Halopseudomonas litoralis]|uniref:Phage integrase family protein n=1 Tax=Halopseudomonas litoralis TaxID=797277 RepID=A0A1H1NSN7_9GAMM|nr:site-specific integrase [Halopseudomonas litoralis]SDS01974.1 Phage integrase family protein [Halopseudomonas litoralis]